MANPIMKIVLGILTLVSVFCIGVSYGFKSGAENQANLESVALGAILTAQVNRLQSGSEKDLRDVEGLMEFYIDFGIDSFNRYQTDGNKILSSVFLEGHLDVLDKSIISLSKFRMDRPDKSNHEQIARLYDADEEKQYLDILKARNETIAQYGAKELTRK